NGFDVPLAAAHISLRGKIGFCRFKKYFARSDRATGQAYSERVSDADVVSLRFRNCGADPRVAKVNDGDNRLAGIEVFAFTRSAHRDRASHWRVDFGVTQHDLGL